MHTNRNTTVFTVYKYLIFDIRPLSVEEMTFICMDHNFECRGRENMKAHIRTHKIFRCNEHNFECRVAENMKTHIRSHLKDLNRFDCTQCSYHTSNKGALAEHMKGHHPF